MFVVRRAFRNYNKMLMPGSIVEPGNIKWFRTRVKDRLIIEVTEQSLDMWEAYFNGKYNTSIKANLAKLEDESVANDDKAEPDTKGDKAEPDTKGDKAEPDTKDITVKKASATGTVKPKVVVVAR